LALAVRFTASSNDVFLVVGDPVEDPRMIADMMVAIDEGAENVHWNETEGVPGRTCPSREGERRAG